MKKKKANKIAKPTSGKNRIVEEWYPGMMVVIKPAPPRTEPVTKPEN